MIETDDAAVFGDDGFSISMCMRNVLFKFATLPQRSG